MKIKFYYLIMLSINFWSNFLCAGIPAANQHWYQKSHLANASNQKLSVKLTEQILKNNSMEDLACRTPKEPSTNVINNILYVTENNILGFIPTENGGALVTGATGVPSILAAEATGIPLVSQGVGVQPAFSTAGVVGGGTGTTTFTNHGILLGNGTLPVVATAAGETGTVLIGNDGEDPSFSATPRVSSITIANTPAIGTDGANKAYVDFIASGLNIQSGCLVVTTEPLIAVYVNGVAGVGATLTNAGVLAEFSLNGQLITVGQRVLIKDQTLQFQNGIYTVTNLGSGTTQWVLTRATDFDTPSKISPGDLVPVQFGTVNANTLWMQTATVTTVGTDPILFQIFLQPGIVNLVGNSGNTAGTIVTVSGGNNIRTSASGETLTVNIAGTTNHALQVGNATNSLTSLGLGAIGQALISAGAGSDPAFGTLSVAGGGTGATTLTNHGVLVGQATSAVAAVGPSTSTGQILQNNAAADPSYSTATYPSTTTINRILYSSANDVVGQITTANGGALVTGATGVPSILAAGATGIPLVSQGAGAQPAFSTAGVSGGGTGQTTLTNHGVLVGQATSAVAAVGPSTSTGQILQNNAAADPSYSTATYPSTTTINRILYSSANDVVGQITTANGGALVTGATGVPSILAAGATGIPLVSQGAGAQPAFSTAGVVGGGTGVTALTAYTLLAGGTTSTNPVQSLAGVGTAGQLLTSNGSSTLPTFQSLLTSAQYSAFGELLTVEPTALIQLQFTYNINQNYVNALTGTTTTGSGTVTYSAPFAVLSTTAATNSTALLSSKNRLHYQPGQGCTALFTSIFTTGVANSSQLIGLGNLNSNTALTFANLSNGLFFGYSGSTFGIFQYNNGTPTFIAQSSWNGDKFNGSGASGVTLDPTKGNVYKIQFQWLGFGAIKFFIENPSDGSFILVHTIQYANANTTTSLLNPTMQLMAAVSNTTNNTNIVLKVPSFTGVIEGYSNPDIAVRYSVSNGFPSTTNESSGSFNNLLTIRNNTTFAGRTNQVIVYPELLTFMATASSESIISLFLNPTFGTALTYTSFSATTSVVDYSSTASVITGGINLLTFYNVGNVANPINLTDFGLLLNPGDVLVIAGRTLSGTNTAYTSMSWLEQIM